MERKGFVTKRWFCLVCAAAADRHNEALTRLLMRFLICGMILPFEAIGGSTPTLMILPAHSGYCNHGVRWFVALMRDLSHPEFTLIAPLVDH